MTEAHDARSHRAQVDRCLDYLECCVIAHDLSTIEAPEAFPVSLTDGPSKFMRCHLRRGEPARRSETLRGKCRIKSASIVRPSTDASCGHVSATCISAVAQLFYFPASLSSALYASMTTDLVSDVADLSLITPAEARTLRKDVDSGCRRCDANEESRKCCLPCTDDSRWCPRHTALQGQSPSARRKPES